MSTRTLALAAILAAASVGLTAVPASAAPASPAVQAETLRVTSGRVPVFADTTAFGGRALAFLTNGAARTAITTTVPADRLVLRVRGDQAYGAPRADVVVDGRRAGTISVGGSRWYDIAVPGRWTPGPHTVEVRFVNDALVRGRDRNLRLDRITFGAAPAAPASSVVGGTTAFESKVVQLVNAERTSRGLAPLAVLGCATGVARDWSATMARTGAFQHRDLAAVRAACEGPGLRAWGENIAYGDGTTPEKMMSMWMNSAGHRANILKPEYTHIGVGAALAGNRLYGTQNFYRVV